MTNEILDFPAPLVSVQDLPASELARIESLGDNCELGFVLRRLGYEGGTLFRWASISPDSLLATLRNDFVDLYAFDNLVAHRDTMVLDQRYGTAWHSGMLSHQANGIRSFVLAESDRRSIFEAEQRKRSYLIAKLRQKFNHPKPVFVLKCNETVSTSIVEALHYQLCLRSGSSEFVLLEVREHPDRAGSVEVIGRTLLRGYVSRFASYEDAANGDDESWRAILVRALKHQHSTQTVRTEASESRAADIVLPFPFAKEPPLTQIVRGDLRAGMARLMRGNNWCRLVDDDVYRLHANAIGTDATVLRWSGVYMPLDWTIDLYAECAIPDSKAVHATLAVTDEEGGMVKQSCVFRPAKPEQIVLERNRCGSGPLTVCFTVEPLERLRDGDRAVVDIQPIVCRPIPG